jgi:hypothetical protein
MKSPPRPIARDMMVSEEDMITHFKIQLAGFDLRRVEIVVLVFLFVGDIMAKCFQDEVI